MRKRPLMQKTIGILGGMSDRATVEYYNFINQAINQELGGWDIAETLVVGCNFGNIEYFVRQKEWTLAEEYLLEKARLAEQGGADVLICMSNTMHKVLGAVQQHITIPFIHIATPTARAINKQGLKKVILLGTKPVMEESYMRAEYEKAGIEVIVPNEEQQQLIDTIIFDELVKNKITQSSKRVYMDICNELIAQGGEGIILGCTEIFLLINQHDFDVHVFNTTQLHVDAVVAFALN